MQEQPLDERVAQAYRRQVKRIRIPVAWGIVSMLTLGLVGFVALARWGSTLSFILAGAAIACWIAYMVVFTILMQRYYQCPSCGKEMGLSVDRLHCADCGGEWHRIGYLKACPHCGRFTWLRFRYTFNHCPACGVRLR